MSSFPKFSNTLLAVCALLTFPVFSATAQHNHASEQLASEDSTIMVMDGYARATFAMAKTGAVYFMLHNQSDADMTLTSVDVDTAIADEAQIHTTEMQGDMMKMREMKEGVTIPANDMVSFESGGYHVMLLGLKKGLEEGSEVSLTLTFDKQTTVHVVLPVKKDENQGHHHHH